MRLAILILLFSAACFGCGGNGFASCATITFDHTKVQSTDQANFPALITGTYTFLKTTTNGGLVTNSSGFDVVFTSDSGCATNLDWEVESWSASTGLVYYWVRVPTLSHTVDTVVYMCAGKPSITTDQSNKTGVWDSDYLNVYHMNTATGSFTQADSTSNNNPLTGQSGAQVSNVAGIISGAQTNNATQKWLGSGQANYPSGTSLNFTIEAWTNIGSLSVGSVAGFNTGSTSNGSAVSLRVGSPVGASTGVDMDVIGSGTYYQGMSLTTGVWYHFAVTSSGATSTGKIYLNSALQTPNTGVASGYSLGSSAHPAAWTFVPFTLSDPWNGTIDELRFSKIARSADWIATEYNNQLNPSTFFSLSQSSFTATQIGAFLTGP